MPGQLEGKIAIITGGGLGFGRALSNSFAKEGAAVAVSDIRLPAADSTVAEVQEAGGQAIAIEVDVAQNAAVQGMVRKTIETFGRVDILVNCAGITQMIMVVDMSEEEWQRVIDVNLTGTFLCCKAMAEPMIAQGSGKIVNIASGRGVTGMAGMAHYSASKGGIIAFTAALGQELGPHGINVNAIAPGMADTPMFRERNTDETARALRQLPPHRRLIYPEDVVGPVMFLATDASREMFGQTLSLKFL